MQAIILAAGTGSRLMPLTHDRPKCLIELAGKSLLQWQLEALNQAKIDKISIVVGYKSEFIIEQYATKFNNIFHNHQYLSTNMVSSLFCARTLFDEDVLVCYGDIIYSPQVVENLFRCKTDFGVVIDKNWYDLWKNRFDHPLDDAETLKIDTEGYIVDIGRKGKISEIEGQYIGLMKFTKRALGSITALFDEGKYQQQQGELVWDDLRCLENAYMTDLLRALIAKGHKLKEIPIEGDWLEVDTYKDYQLYQRCWDQSCDNSFVYNLGRS